MKNNNRRLIKIIISVLAVLNLILLFFFQYGQKSNTGAAAPVSMPGLGTTLSLPSRFSAVTDLDLPNLGQKLAASGSLKAVDAKGSDITDRITIEIEQDARDERIAHAVFSVQGDDDEEPISISASIPVTLNRPVLVLAADTAELALNDTFAPLTYVREAVDASGVSILENTVIIGRVDTGTPGTYSVTFQAKDVNGYVSDPKTLTVTVG